MRQPFHGWRIVMYASVAVVLTAPGQTPGVSPFIDPVMAELGLSRSAVSTAYLIGTLVGAAAMPTVGRLIDRIGARLMMAAIGAVFGSVLIGLSMVSGIVSLTAGFVGIRLAGQGALGLTAVTVVAYWFDRRRGTALGMVSAVGAAGITLAPILIERLIAYHDWRTVWLLEGLAVWLIVIPIAVLGIRNRPHLLGQHIDGDSAPARGDRVGGNATRAAAMRTGYFWVLIAGNVTVGMLVTAVTFHQISLLGERGLTSGQAAANFLPQTAAGLAATFLTGVLVDRLSRPRLLIVASMCLLAGALVAASVLGPGWSAMSYGAALGAAMGVMKTVESALTPRMFGTAHLGAIRGVVAAAGVAGSAVGPVLFAVGHEATGAYTAVLLASVAAPAVVAVAALLTPLPVAAHRTARTAA